MLHRARVNTVKLLLKDVLNIIVTSSPLLCSASDKCQREKRKTINGDDLLWAMGRLDFNEYIEPLKVYLAKFRESEKVAQGPGGKGSVGQSNDA